MTDEFDNPISIPGAIDRQCDLVEFYLGKGMVDLLRDDIGWDLLGDALSTSQHGTIRESERRYNVRLARQSAILDAMVSHAVRLYRTFAFGRPLAADTSDDGLKDDLTSVWAGDQNASVFGFRGQQSSSNQLITDGELFFPVFGTGPEAKVRRIDPLQIIRIVSNPEDSAEKWWHLREWIESDTGTEVKRAAYKDMFAPKTLGDPPEGFEPVDDVVIHHTAVNTMYQRGHSMLTAAMPWAKAFRRFMESRIAIQQSLARYAWKKKVKGGQAQVNAEIAKEQSGLVTGDVENNPPPSFAATATENMAVDRTPLKQETGAAAAQTDGTLILATFGASVGIFPHYFGLDTLSRMSTSQSMELPMLRMFQSWQSLFVEIYTDILAYALGTDDESSVRETIEIIPPLIVERDAPLWLGAINTLANSMPEIVESDEVRTLVLQLLGVRNPQDVLETIKDGEEEREANRPPPPPIPPPGQQPQIPPAEPTGRLAPVKQQSLVASMVDVVAGFRGIDAHLAPVIEAMKDDGNGSEDDE